VNTKADLQNFKPKKEYFIGIDSDGTVFDSMNIKHIKSMCPAALEIWDIDGNRGEFEKIWYNYNLYSADRGSNRFLGLLYAFEQMIKITDKPPAADISPLQQFVKNNQVLSNDTLRAWMRENPSPLLDDVMRWSERSDELFDEYTHGILPYNTVKTTFEIMAEKADIMAVSSASGKGLDKDWGFSGLLDYIVLLAGQEIGSKKTQLQTAASGKYPCRKILMIGDAPGDLDAARSIDALFFPIMPGSEEESWTLLKDEALPRFFGNGYHGGYEAELVSKFKGLLNE